MAERFKVGDKVVYPNHGVALIYEVKSVSVGEDTEECYCLRVASNNTKVMIPLGKADEIGMRKVMDDKEAKRLMRRLRDPDVTTGTDWKERFQENAEKMRTGSIRDVADVIKSLTVLSEQKDLSDREKRMLERARYLLVSEMAAADDSEEDKVEEKVDKALETLVKKMRGDDEEEEPKKAAKKTATKAAAAEDEADDDAKAAKKATKKAAAKTAKKAAKKVAKKAAKKVAKKAAKKTAKK
ncbi:MAG: CarD family transcriptional regulator [Acidobacteriota bacterium]